MSEDIAADINQHIAESTPAPAEKMLSQSEVDKLVGAVRAKERAQAEAQYRQTAGSMGGMQQSPPSFDEEAMLEKATARMQQQLEEQRRALEEQQHKAQVEDVVRNYVDRMKQGPTLYNDFDEVMSDYNPAAFPQVTVLASQMENLPDIMYELSKNPTKLTHLHTLAIANPELARKEMTKLSQSIKRNEDALNSNVKSPSPLSKIKPSAIAGSDNGKRSISDLRKDPKYRG